MTFMPKPIFGDNGSGMHTHQSLWKEGTPLMADKSGYAGLSQLARAYIGGLLAHAPALLAFCAPTTNSYRRLVPGYEAPVNLVYSQRNRSACIRIPMYSESPKAKRDRVPLPGRGGEPVPRVRGDADGRPRRDRATGLDAGRARRLRPLRGGARRRAAGARARSTRRSTRSRPTTSSCTKGGVFSEELIRTWIDYKRENEVDVVRLRPHPAEFSLYFDC